VVHEPVTAAHTWQTPLQVALAQQKPPLQTPLAHCALVVHAPPAFVSATHAPEALQ
jgi:hypothetical protein